MVVGHGFLELVDPLQVELADLGDGLDLELVHDVPHVVAGPGRQFNSIQKGPETGAIILGPLS